MPREGFSRKRGEAGEEFDETLTKAAASRKIEELQAKTGRGKK